jgi:hypothetical protein
MKPRTAILLLVGFLTGEYVSAQALTAGTQKDSYTIVQTATPFDAKSNIQADLALVAAVESAQSLASAAATVQFWRDHGYRVFGFAAVARVDDYDMNGGWRDLDGVVDPGHPEGEVQHDRSGGKFGPPEIMMTPSLRLMEHKKPVGQGLH